MREYLCEEKMRLRNTAKKATVATSLSIFALTFFLWSNGFFCHFEENCRLQQQKEEQEPCCGCLEGNRVIVSVSRPKVPRNQESQRWRSCACLSGEEGQQQQQ